METESLDRLSAHSEPVRRDLDRPTAARTWRATRSVGLFGPSVFGVSAAAVALPAMTADLGASPTSSGWVLTVHALALGIGTALFGRLADVWGIRWVLFAATLLLAGGSVAVVAAPNLAEVVLGRVVLAAGSGATVAVSLTINATTPDPERRRTLSRFGSALAVFAGGATVAGGTTTSLASWRWTLVLPALSLLAVPGALAVARDHHRRPARVDILGALLLAGAAVAAVLAVQSRTLRLGAPAALAITAAGVVLVAGLARHTRRSRDPFVPRRLVRERRLALLACSGAATYAAFFAAAFVVPQTLTATGWSALGVGTVLLPASAAGVACSRAVGRVPLGAQYRVVAGVQVLFVVALIVAAATATGTPSVVAVSAAGFAAFAVTQVVATAQVSALVGPQERGSVLGVLNLVFFVGGSVGSATAGAALDVTSAPVTYAVLAGFPLLGVILTVGLDAVSRRHS